MVKKEKPTKEEIINDAVKVDICLSVNGRLDGMDGSEGIYVLTSGKLAKIKVLDYEKAKRELKENKTEEETEIV